MDMLWLWLHGCIVPTVPPETEILSPRRTSTVYSLQNSVQYSRVCTYRLIVSMLIHRSDNNSSHFTQNSMVLRHDLLGAITAAV